MRTERASYRPRELRARTREHLAEARALRGRLIPVMRQRDVASLLGITASRVERLELAALDKVLRAFWYERVEAIL